MAIQPGQTVDYHYSWNTTQPIRLITAFGHRHAWTTNFSSWIEEPGGQLDIIYQSSSGVRTLMPGQKLHFNCHIEYTDARAMSERAPRPSQIGTLRFANEAFTGEMCIMFGSTAAVKLPAPTADRTPLPDFTQ